MPALRLSHLGCAAVPWKPVIGRLRPGAHAAVDHMPVLVEDLFATLDRRVRCAALD